MLPSKCSFLWNSRFVRTKSKYIRKIRVETNPFSIEKVNNIQKKREFLYKQNLAYGIFNKFLKYNKLMNSLFRLFSSLFGRDNNLVSDRFDPEISADIII